MNRPPREREREREAGQFEDDNLDPKAMVRSAPSPRRAQPLPQQSWFRRNWVSIVGVSAGLIASIWKFGIPQMPHHMRIPRDVAGVATQTFNWHGPIAAGHQVTVKGNSGGIRAVAAEGNEVVMTAIKRSRGGNAAEVPIAVLQEGGDVTFCAATPGEPNSCPMATMVPAVS